MPYPLTIGMTKADFKREILAYYFPTLCGGTDAAFADDYAAIGAFLTRTDEVKLALRPLEERLRALALAKATSLATGGPAPVQHASMYNSKDVTTKILTSALADIETRAGFNSATAGLLHNESMYGSGSGDHIDLSTIGRTRDGKRLTPDNAALPAGVPKIIGNINPTDFMVLLKHGYSFKDVGADSAHGEFTHRLQWCAIIEAKGRLGLQKTPIELYKKMWFTGTKGTHNIGSGRSLYMWMALLDNVSSDGEAAAINSMAWSANTYNNPEVFNASFNTGIAGVPFQTADTSNLYVLCKLLGARRRKRALGGYDASDKYHGLKMTDTGAGKTVLAGMNQTAGPTPLSNLKHVVAWIDSL
jgi:Family of unknown function (DUF5636)